MTGDAELRARIEAQVAARRASSSSESGRQGASGSLAGAAPSPGTHRAPRRPRPGPDSRAAAGPLPLELATSADATASAAPSSTPHRVDLSRILEATKPEAENAEVGGGKRGDGWRRHVLRTGVVVVIAALAAFLLRVYVVQPYYIPSESMEPTLHGCAGCNDDHVLVDKVSYRIHGPRSGDIVVFHRPEAVDSAEIPEKALIKRVVAVGLDRIAIKKGHVFVNRLVLDEPYLNKDHSCYPSMNMAAQTVPKGDVFVMGDNRCDSRDSRFFGPVPDSSIIGRAFAIVWPINRLRLLH